MNSNAVETRVDIVERGGRKIELWQTIRQLLKVRLAVVGFAAILVVVICAIFAPWIAPHDPLAINVDNLLEKPSWTFPLGTDYLGRDTLSRTIYGARVALIVGIGSSFLSAAMGVPIGLFAAYSRGWVDDAIMRIIDALRSFPGLIIALALVAVLGGSLINVVIAIGTSGIAWQARIVRSQALSVRERDYVKAAISIGCRDLRIMYQHLLPNCIAPVIVQATIGMAYAILAEAALGFLGLSVQPPTPTWGNMLRFAFRFMDTDPLLSIVPGMAIFWVVLGFNLLGDAVRDFLDPRLRGLFQ